eukprot:COSAG06_NODE_228_length_19725_cov_8.167839_1_plen_50_part_00
MIGWRNHRHTHQSVGISIWFDIAEYSVACWIELSSGEEDTNCPVCGTSL